MIIIGIVGDIGSGKSYVAKQFGYPVFNADSEVTKIYKNSKYCFRKLKDNLPKYIKSFPVNKTELMNAILANKKNIYKINRIVHPLVRKQMNLFFFKNKKKKFVILDIPLLLENKIYKKNFFLVFIQAKKSDISKRIKKRKNFNKKLFSKLKKIQLPLDYKRKKSNFIIKNNYTKKNIKKDIQNILSKIS